MSEIKLFNGLPGAQGMTERVRRACMRYVQNRDEADDMAQEVWIKAFREGNRASGEIAWLLRVAANQCLDHLRREKRQRLRAAAWAREAPEPESPEDTDGGILEGVRARLNESDRKLLHLRYDLGLPQGAIAEILGVSRPRVAQRLAAIHLVGSRVCRGLGARLPREGARVAPRSPPGSLRG